jgi:putative protease
MAARKKAKAKRKKAPAKRPAARRKTAKVAKKPARKAPARRAPRKKARPAARRAAAKPVPVAPVALPPPGERIGVVTHYFSHLAVAVVKLEAATLRVGDTIHIRGHTTDFKQRVDSLEVNHAPVQEAGPGDDFGLKVREHVREHDVVYKVK